MTEMTDSLRDDIQQAFEEHEFRRSQPYDGVMGTLPQEWPANFQADFERTRDKLLGEYSPDELQKFIAEIIDIPKQALSNPEESPFFRMQIPWQISDEVALLAGFLTASHLGVNDGLAFLTGRAHADLVKKGREFRPGRQEGALNDKTRYLIDLINRYPGARRKSLFKVACEDAEDGLSPFGYSPEDGGLLLDNGKKIDSEKFVERISTVRRRYPQ